MIEEKKNNCPRCKTAFNCEVASGHCWCFELPQVMPYDEAVPGCYCPKCLKELIDLAAQTNEQSEDLKSK